MLHGNSPLTRRRTWSRLKVLLLLCWLALGTFGLATSLPHLSKHAKAVLWTFYQPLLPPLLMLWLWAHNVGIFEQRHIHYTACFSEQDKRFCPSNAELVRLATYLSCLLLAVMSASASFLAASSSALPLLLPPLLYGLLLVLLVAPINILLRPVRKFFGATLLRVFLPLQPVSWADFLLADMLTSLAKSGLDLERAGCLMLQGPLAHPSHPDVDLAVARCAPLRWQPLAALVLPYCLRLVQCCSVWYRGGPRTQLLNAAKYASSLPALILTAAEHEAHVRGAPFPFKGLWVGVMLVNSLYSYYWDVEQDWDMPWLVTPGAYRLGPLPLPSLKPRPLYGQGWYSWALCSNLLLRLTWAHRLLGDLEAHDEVLLVVALLEVVRRWQWAFIRIETELRKLGHQGPTPAAAAAAAEGQWDPDDPQLQPLLHSHLHSSGGKRLSFEGLSEGSLPLYASSSGGSLPGLTRVVSGDGAAGVGAVSPLPGAAGRQPSLQAAGAAAAALQGPPYSADGPRSGWRTASGAGQWVSVRSQGGYAAATAVTEAAAGAGAARHHRTASAVMSWSDDEGHEHSGGAGWEGGSRHGRAGLTHHARRQS